MANMRVAFEKISHTVNKIRNGKCVPGFRSIWCHIIFDMKMGDNFTRKERRFEGVHMIEPPASITY